MSDGADAARGDVWPAACGDEAVTFSLVVDGVKHSATYTRDTVEQVFVPLIERWERMAAERAAANRRVVVFLAAPPGSGKSTMAHALESVSASREGEPSLQALPLDGFHFHQKFLETHDCVVDGRKVLMRDVKGTLETFDYERFLAKLCELRAGGRVLWPTYDRGIHDVREDALAVDAPIALIEGNWLLSCEPPWNEASKLADDTVFLAADERLLHERLVRRKASGGLSMEDAERWYQRSDGRNVRRVLERRQNAAVELALSCDGRRIFPTKSITTG